MARKRPPYSVPRGRPELLGRSLFRLGRRNAGQKLGYLKNRGVPPPLIERLRPFADQARGRDLEWFARQLSEALHRSGPDLNRMMAVEAQMLDELPAVLDWLQRQRPNYSGMSWTGARDRSDAWHAAIADKRPRKKRMRSRDVVMDLPDKWAWVSVPLKEYKDEGELMGHCLNPEGHYRHLKAYSLRDPWNRPHVTLTVDERQRNAVLFKEAKGKGNATPPALPYSKMTLAFMETRPFGPHLSSATDLERIVNQVYPDKAKALEVLRSFTPLEHIRNRVASSVELDIPEYLRQRAAAKNPKLIPDLYGRNKIHELLERLAVERSPARMVEWAKTITVRMDELIRLANSTSLESTQKFLDTEFGGKIRADLATLKRKARSDNIRDRIAAAALLPPNSLGVLLKDPSNAVWSVAALRAGSNVAEAFLDSQLRGGPGRVPHWGRAWTAHLVWKMNKKSFARRWKEGRGFGDKFGPYQLTAVERAVELGLLDARKLNPKEFDDIDFVQFMAQIVPFKETGRWVRWLWELWQNEQAWESGAAQDVLSFESLGKFLAAEPEPTIQEVYDPDILEIATTWLWGRPTAARRVMNAVFDSALGEQAWEMADNVDGDLEAICSVFQPFYVGLRVAGESRARAGRALVDMTTYRDLPEGPAAPAQAEACLASMEAAYKEERQRYKENGKRLTI